MEMCRSATLRMWSTEETLVDRVIEQVVVSAAPVDGIVIDGVGGVIETAKECGHSVASGDGPGKQQ
eukprot:3869588-Pleurochrysis_carterae.AAC.1